MILCYRLLFHNTPITHSQSCDNFLTQKTIPALRQEAIAPLRRAHHIEVSQIIHNQHVSDYLLEVPKCVCFWYTFESL